MTRDEALKALYDGKKIWASLWCNPLHINYPSIFFQKIGDTIYLRTNNQRDPGSEMWPEEVNEIVQSHESWEASE